MAERITPRGTDPVALLGAAALRAIVERASDAIFVIDPAGVFRMANAATGVLAGLTPRALRGLAALPFIDTPDQLRVDAEMRAVLAGADRRFECAVLGADGVRRIVSVAASPAVEGGAISGALCVARDVTEERAQAEALERAEARYTRLFEAAEDAIATLDEEGHITSVNRSLEEVIGRTRTEMVGRHFADFVDASERAAMWEVFTATLRGDKPYRELRFTRGDGTHGIATVRAAPVVESGRITGVLAIMRDVSDEQRLMEQVVRREKLAALGEIVGGVAHEINTPLTGILAFAQLMLARGALDGEARQAAETIAAEAKRAARIVGKLLTFARQTPPERAPVDLNQLVGDTVELRRLALRDGGVQLEVVLDAAVPVTWADAGQLQQVLLNLLANAEQAVTGAAERRITVHTRRQGEAVVVSVADTGRGIAPEHRAHIFNPFFTTKPRGIGTGLGLSISDGIVREHDGLLRVESEPGRGACFEVVLPVVVPPQPEQPPAHGEHPHHR